MAASSVSASQGSLEFQIDIAVLQKQLSAARQQGAAAVELLQAAAQLSQAIGKGEEFDAVA